MLADISILVLEDDADTLDLFVGTLRKLGAEVRAATTAAAALDLAARWRPDAVLCDLHLQKSTAIPSWRGCASSPDGASFR